MSKKSGLLLGIAFIAIGLLVSCSPTCAEDALVAAHAISPSGFELVDSLTPTLTWEYPDPSCKPEGYRIEIYKAPEYTLYMTGGASGGDSTTWSPATDLPEHSVFWWTVKPIVGTTLGPMANQPRFITGPICDSAALNPPIITSPEDMEIITSSTDYIYILNPDNCLPEGNQVQYSKDPTFADQETYESSVPAVVWIMGDLDDCTYYYLRAIANNGPVYSQFSPTTTIFTNINGLCPTPPATASISGTVWNENCSVGPTGPMPAPLPEGCVDNGGGGAWADAIQQPGEPGIPNVTVMYGKGDCPSCGLGTVETDANGYYTITALQAGKYCLCINAEDNPNIILDGMWTLKMSGHEGWTYRHFPLFEGQYRSDQDFAWWHYPETVGPSSFNEFSFYCTSDPDLFMADFTFGKPVTDTLELRFAEVKYPCMIDPHNSNLVHCYGKRIDENQSVKLTLQDMSSQTKVASFDTKTPICGIEPITPQKVNCAQYNMNQCPLQAECKWVFSSFGPGFCQNK
jgi:hypothetical protein